MKLKLKEHFTHEQQLKQQLKEHCRHSVIQIFERAFNFTSYNEYFMANTHNIPWDQVVMGNKLPGYVLLHFCWHMQKLEYARVNNACEVLGQ